MKTTFSVMLALAGLLMASVPALGQDQTSQVRELEGYLQSCEQSLATRRQEESGQDPVSQNLKKKIEAANAVLDDRKKICAASCSDWAFNLRWEAEHKYEDALNELGAHKSKMRYLHQFLPTTDMENQCSSLRTRLAAARQAEQEAARRRAIAGPQPWNGGGNESGPNPPVQPDTPASEPARNALLQAIQERHQRWYATWCQRLSSGCAIVPDGVRDELRQWTRKATKQRQIERIRRLLDGYDSCVMAGQKSERQVGQCRNQCKDNIR